jgi:branched-chain amino acid transport system substrate-binding protein
MARHGALRRLSAALIAGVLLLTLAGCSSSGSTQSEGNHGGTPIKIGAILSLTGPYAALGTAEKNALDLELKRINEAGGINGRKVEIVIEDDGTDEAKAVAAATKLIEQDKVVAILGATGTGQSMAARTVIDRAGIPMISMAGGNAITGKFDPLVFQTPWPNSIVVPFVLKKMAADGRKKVALISDNGGYGKDGHAVIVETAPKLGLTIVADQQFKPGDTDFAAQITTAKNSGADAILLWTAGKEGAAIVKQAGALGVKLPMYGGSGQAKSEFPTGAGAAADGFIFGTGKSLVPSNWGSGTPEFQVVDGFAKRYEAAYGSAPDIFAGHAFDALSILADSIKRASSTSPAALRDAVEQTKNLVGFGGSFTFTSTDHNGLTEKDLSLYKVGNTTWVTVQ